MIFKLREPQHLLITLGDHVALLESKDFNASVMLGMLINVISKWLYSGTRALKKWFSF